MSKVTELWRLHGKCGCFVKLLLKKMTKWTRNSLESFEVLLQLLKPTTLKLTVYKDRPSRHCTVKTYSPYNWQDSFLLLCWNPQVIQKSFGWSLESWWPGQREGRESTSIFMCRISFPHYSNVIQNTLPDIQKMFCKKNNFNGYICNRHRTLF